MPSKAHREREIEGEGERVLIAYRRVLCEDTRRPREKMLFVLQDSGTAAAFIGLSARRGEHSGRWWSG